MALPEDNELDDIGIKNKKLARTLGQCISHLILLSAAAAAVFFNLLSFTISPLMATLVIIILSIKLTNLMVNVDPLVGWKTINTLELTNTLLSGADFIAILNLSFISFIGFEIAKWKLSSIISSLSFTILQSRRNTLEPTEALTRGVSGFVSVVNYPQDPQYSYKPDQEPPMEVPLTTRATIRTLSATDISIPEPAESAVPAVDVSSIPFCAVQ